MLLNLVRRWKFGIPCDFGGLDVFVALYVLSVDHIVFHDAILDSSYLDIPSTPLMRFGVGLTDAVCEAEVAKPTGPHPACQNLTG